MNGSLNQGYFFAASAAACWGMIFIACKLVYQSDIGPFLLLFLRYFIATTGYLIVYKRRPRPRLNRAEKKSIIIIGTLGYFLQTVACFTGAAYVSATMGSIINATTPVLIMLIAGLSLRETITLQKFSGIIIVTLGAIIIIGFTDGNSTAVGIWLNFASVMCWSLATVMIRKYSVHMDAVWLTIYASIVAMLIDIPFACIEIYRAGFELGSITNLTFISIAVLGIFGTMCSNIWWSKALEVLPATTCSIFYALMPVTTALLEIFILDEALSSNFFIGGVIIMIGMFMTLLSKKESNTI